MKRGCIILKINALRLKENILKTGEIGKEQNGITRLAFSPEYDNARDVLKGMAEQYGLEVQVDGVGNLFAKKSGKMNLPSIMLGSHLDTVKNGGLLDGNLGVIAALECLLVLCENQVETNHPVEMVAFNAEEGSEMGGTFGSRVMIGRQDLNEKDLEKKLAVYNLSKKDILSSMRPPESIKAFMEMHIEQGGILEEKELSIGIVNGIVGITRYKIIVHGEANHAGTTPMNQRNDALVTASKLICEIDKRSKTVGNPFVTTVGQLEVFPGSVNVIPGKVEFSLELRDLGSERIKSFMSEMERLSKELLDAEVEFELQIDKPTIETNVDLNEILEKLCIKNKILYQVMASGAGHDAKEIANKVPTSMVFIPSIGGKSHCADEASDWEDISTGTQLLLDALMEVDKIL